MRSRLEASFAEMLDDQLYEWTYEPMCYASKGGQYLPDFHVYFHWRDDWEYCEVKPPNADFDEALRKMHIILASEPLARLGVWSKQPRRKGEIAPPLPGGTWTDPLFLLVARCTPDDPCVRCGREKLPRGYERP